MALDRALCVLELLKPVAKAVPVVGASLEGAIDVAIQGCGYVKVCNCCSLGWASLDVFI
jgi:hypothetical protein